MNSEKIQNLVAELVGKKVDYIGYDGRKSQTELIREGNSVILEQIIRQHLLDNRDEVIGTLQAKVFAYEQIISKSNFSLFIEQPKPKEEIKEPEA